MSLTEALMKRGRCPTDGTRLSGRFGFCRSCCSTWFPLLDGSAGGAEPFHNLDAEDPRAYLRRKLAELDAHKLSPIAAPPLALSRLQAGTRHGTLLNPGKARAFAQAAQRRDFDSPVIGRQYK